MKKENVLVILFILSVLFITTSVIAANDTIDASYACLKKQLGSDCGNTQNTVQNAFSLIAMAYDSGVQGNCKSALTSKKKTDCWGDTASSSACSIKATAISTLALKNINTNVDDSINYLKSKKKLATDLTWYLEIDSNNATECTINGQKININENKKILGSDPSGLKKAYNSFWLEIVDLRKNYTISCTSNFITTLLFKKPSSGVYFVSSLTHSGAGGDSTTESVNGFCIGISDKCDYEGTLWSALALSKSDEDIAPYMPYLAAMADDPANKKYFPLAFLYALDNSVDDYLQGILNLQKQKKYWKEGDDLLYDTAIALMAIQGSTVDQGTNAKDYLLTLRETSGDLAGCWKSNTALILFSGWPKNPTSTPSDPGSSSCASFNFFCVSRGECLDNNTLINYKCAGISDICCQVRPAEQTCTEKGGIVCADKEECSESVIPSQDTESCCMKSCQAVAPATNECEDNKGFCRTECGKGQKEQSLYQSSCGFNEKCCITNPTPAGPNWWLIILLIILIILVVLAIIFRNQLKIYWFKVKSKFSSKKGPEQTRRPGPPIPPPYMNRPMMSRQIIPRQAPPISRPGPRPPMPPQRPQPPRPGTDQGKKPDKDKEFDETMKKLRDMSK